MTKVTSIEACTVSLPLPSPVSFSTRTVSSREYTLVRVQGDDGIHGIGFTYVSNGGGHLATLAIRELLAPVALGQDAFRVEGLWASLYQLSLVHGRKGSVMRGLSALDIALWDRNARAMGLPLWKYLGGFAEGRIPCYASGGYYLEATKTDVLAEEAQTYVDAGYKAVKIKVGRLDPIDETRRVEVVRETIGANVLLLLDANNAWRDLPTALRAVRSFEPFDPYWIEEPFLPDDIESHRRLAERISVPVATGELEAGRWSFKELLEHRAADIIQPDATGCGGITEFRRIAATAAAFGVPVCPHWMHDLHVHLAAAIPDCLFVEFFPDNRILNFRELITSQLEVSEGELLLPNEPGLGFDFIDEVVRKHSIDGWD